MQIHTIYRPNFQPRTPEWQCLPTPRRAGVRPHNHASCRASTCPICQCQPINSVGLISHRTHSVVPKPIQFSSVQSLDRMSRASAYKLRLANTDQPAPHGSIAHPYTKECKCPFTVNYTHRTTRPSLLHPVRSSLLLPANHLAA